MEQKWIPVSERFPNDGQEVLFCTDRRLVHQGFYYGEGGMNWISRVSGAWFHVKRVTAWMPLPEPYEPKGGD